MASRCGESPAPALLRGIEQFNRREYFECHEVLEEGESRVVERDIWGGLRREPGREGGEEGEECEATHGLKLASPLGGRDGEG